MSIPIAISPPQMAIARAVTIEASTEIEAKGRTPVEAVVVDTAVGAVVVDAVIISIHSGNNLLLGNSGNRVPIGLLLHVLILLIGHNPIIAQKLNKMEFLVLSHNQLPLLQLGPAQQILKLLSTLCILLSQTHLGTWTPEQHLI
jgi:hypothetical protein